MALSRRAWIRIFGWVVGVPVLLFGLTIGGPIVFSAWNIIGAGERAKARVTRVTLQQIGAANRAYVNDHGTPAPTLEALAGYGITALMLNDGWKQRLVYRPAATGTNLELFSVGPHGAAGTADDLSAE